MISETEQQRHLVDLEFLQVSLQHADINAALINASEKHPLSFLTGSLPPRFNSPEAIFKLVYVPAENLLKDVAMLQIYVFLTDDLDTLQMDTPPFINAMNQYNMMGYFNIDEAASFYFRYVYSLPRFDAPNEDAFLEIINLSFENFSRFANLTLQYSTGKINSEKAMSFFKVQK